MGLRYVLQSRILDKIQRDESGCWIWTAAIRANGYGALKVDGKTMDAHRAAYLAWRGPIPLEQLVSRTCHTPLCVNPDHLALLTRRENVLLSIADQRRLPYVRRRLLSGAEETAVVASLQHGHSQREVRERFQISVSSLQRLMVRHGLRPLPAWMQPRGTESHACVIPTT